MTAASAFGKLLAFPPRKAEAAAPTLDGLTDLGLAAACAAGDEAARTELVLRHVDAVHAFVARSRGAEEVVDDLVQMTFLAAFQGAAKFRGPALRGWLLGIAANLVRSHIRTDVARKKAIARFEAQPVPEPRDPLGDAALQDQVASAIAALPPKLREAIVLVDLGGERAVDVARALGVPEGTVWRRLSEARERLRALLGGVA